MEYTKTIHNVETGEVVIEPLTADEIEQLELRRAEKEAKRLAEAEAAAAKEAARQAVLEKLGLTTDEIQALLG